LDLIATLELLLFLHSASSSLVNSPIVLIIKNLNIMNLCDFCLLSMEQKRSAVLKDAVLIDKRNKDHMVIFLLQLHAFYVEMYYDLRKNNVDGFRFFDETTLLDPYLKNIQIDELMN